MTETENKTTAEVVPGDMPISGMDPAVLAEMVERQAKGARLAELEFEAQRTLPTEVLQHYVPIDTYTQIIRFGDFGIYEVPILDPENHKELIAAIVFVPSPWGDVTGGWSINIPTAHEPIVMTGDLFWWILRGRTYSARLRRHIMIVQHVMSPKLGILGADVRKQLEMLPKEQMVEALALVQTYKEAEMFEFAMDAEAEKKTWKSIATQKIESHRDTAEDISGHALKAHATGAAAFAKQLLEAMGIKDWVKVVGLLALFIGGFAFMAKMAGWW